MFCVFSTLLLTPFALKLGAFIRVAPFVVSFLGFVVCSRVYTSHKCRNRLLSGVFSAFFMLLVFNIISVLVFREKLTTVFFVKFILVILGGVVGGLGLKKCRSFN